jgi:hypothetical protein
MGKAAKRQRRRVTDYLARLSYEEPERFEYQWDKRMGSWLREIRDLAEKWAQGKATRKRVFGIVDRAMEILEACDEKIYRKYGPKTFGQLSHECAAQLAIIIDPRLYRLSNQDAIEKTTSQSQR